MRNLVGHLGDPASHHVSYILSLFALCTIAEETYAARNARKTRSRSRKNHDSTVCAMLGMSIAGS
jgi:hypothetical protein